MLSSTQQRDLLVHVRHMHRITGFVALITCNRIEFYAALEPPFADKGFAILESVLVETGYPLGHVEAHIYRLQGREVAQHIARVASGLESVVVGEAEVLGQVGRAAQVADQCGTLDPYLKTLFQFAIKAGRRARESTAINRHPVSVSSVAVRIANRHLGTLDGKTVAVVGLGEAGALAIKAIQAHAIAELLVVNRTFATAVAQAETYEATAYPIYDLPDVLRRADVLFTATGCPFTLIDHVMVEQAVATRSERPLVLLDMAVPHDIDPTVASLNGVYLLDVDHLKDEVTQSLQTRQQAIPQVEAILEEELERFMVWLHQAEVRPLITDLRRQAEGIRQQELQRLLRHCPDMDEAMHEHIQRFSHALVQKLLHHPTTRLRQEAGHGDASAYAETIRTLFAL